MGRSSVCRTVGYVRADGSHARFTKPLTRTMGKREVRFRREMDELSRWKLEHGTEAERILEAWFAYDTDDTGEGA